MFVSLANSGLFDCDKHSILTIQHQSHISILHQLSHLPVYTIYPTANGFQSQTSPWSILSTNSIIRSCTCGNYNKLEYTTNHELIPMTPHAALPPAFPVLRDSSFPPLPKSSVPYNGRDKKTEESWILLSLTAWTTTARLTRKQSCYDNYKIFT